MLCTLSTLRLRTPITLDLTELSNKQQQINSDVNSKMLDFTGSDLFKPEDNYSEQKINYTGL